MVSFGTRRIFAAITFFIASQMTLNAGTVTDALERYAGNIHQFSRIFPQEKVYIQFDNTSYYAGETIWFKAYVVNAADHHRAPSKVLYVDLLSPGGAVLKQQKLQIVAGQCDGSFPLLDASTGQARELRGVLPYPSGFYEVRAYTMNMLNFNQEAIFSRVLPIYEKPTEEGGYYNEAPSIKLHDTFIEQYRPKVEKHNKIDVGFYPEGGRMIIGKQCRVAFKVTGNDGLGLDASGTLDGTDVAFKTIHDGMGSLTFTPERKSNSITILTSDGKTHHFNMPDAVEEGYSLTVKRDNDNLVTIISGTDNMSTDTLGLAVMCRDGLDFFQTVSQPQHEAEVRIPLDFKEGVCRIVLFDRNGNILASRTFYSESEIPSPRLTFTPDKEKYGPFQKINLDFYLVDGRGNPFRDRFCLSVRDSRTSGNMESGDIRTGLLLSSDLKGYVHNPEWYFETDDESREEALDLLMMVQGWERYEWNTMTGINNFEEKHRVEKNLTLNGWVLSPSGNKPIPNIKVMAAIVPPDKKKTEQFDCITDTTGYFGLDISDFYDVARLTIHTTEKRRLVGTSSRILFERSMTPELRAYHPAETTLRNITSKNKTAKKKEEPEEAGDNLPEVIWDNLGYLLPDVDIEGKRKYIDYYTFKAFNVQHDVQAELDRAEFSGDIYGYLLEKGFTLELDSSDISDDTERSDVTVAYELAEISHLNGETHAFWYVHDNQHCLYSGIYCPPWNIDTQDIKSLMVYERVMPLTSVLELMPLFSHGQVNIGLQQEAENDTKNYYLIDMELRNYDGLSSRKDLMEIGKRITTVTGYSSPYQFYSPSYPNGPILGDVDYRRTLYWEPNVITDAEGHATVSFYNNSQTSDFSISGAGITASGQPYVLESGF